MELKGSRTETNLIAAFAGESQARNKYTYYANKARENGYMQIVALFEETAENERAHAKIWFELLHGGTIPETDENLTDAAAGEAYEHTEMYPAFAAVASSVQASGWHKGSPPESVSPSSSGFAVICRMISLVVASRPPAKSWLSGLWQPGQLCGQPCTNTEKRIPGPSTMESSTVPKMRIFMTFPPAHLYETDLPSSPSSGKMTISVLPRCSSISSPSGP